MRTQNLSITLAVFCSTACWGAVGLRTAPVVQPASTTATAGGAWAGQPFVSSTGIEMLYIPPGNFLMGSTAAERTWAVQSGCGAGYGEVEGKAPRKTDINQSFWIGKTEVTVGQWKQFVKETGYVTDGEKAGVSRAFEKGGGNTPLVKGANWKNPGFGFNLKDNYPVSCISWNDAMAFCAWLNDREAKAGRLPPGFKVRLPTEAEWEYACRAGTQTKFWWGETEKGGDDRLNWHVKGDGFQFVSPVDHYKGRGRNRFGLADMLGNVREWCLDFFDRAGAHENYNAEASSTGRVVRGGAFFDHHRAAGYARCASRQSLSPSASYANTGFRVAMGMAR